MHVSTYEKKIEPTLAHKSKLPYKPNRKKKKKDKNCTVCLPLYYLDRNTYIWTETAVQIRWHKARTLGKK